MIFLPQCLVLSTLLLSALSSPTPQDKQRQQQQQQHSSRAPADAERFQRLLADVDDSSIHSALHSWSSKFQDGVFSHDRTALEAVHSENAPLATSLLHLAKRQIGSNTTTTSAEPTSAEPTSAEQTSAEQTSAEQTSGPPPTPSTSSGIILPVSSRTTATRAPTTEAVPVSTPPSATPIATSDGRVVFSLSASSGATATAGALTTVDATSQLVSFRPSSSIVLSTFTLPDGSVSTQTSVTVVDAPVTGGTLGAPAATGTGGAGNPSLQDGGASSATRGVWREVVVVVGGAVVMGLAM